MSEIEALEKRKKVVADQIVRLREELASLETELMELDMAGKVLARVTGHAYGSGDTGPDIVYGGAHIQCKNLLSIASASAFSNSHYCEANERYRSALPLISHFRHFAGGGPGWHPMANKKLSLPEQITVAMEYAHQNDKKALAPKEIEHFIILLFGNAPEKQNVNSVVWRMAKTGAVCKADDAPMYWLPHINKTADTSPAKGQSAALGATRAKGREAVPGGGT